MDMLFLGDLATNKFRFKNHSKFLYFCLLNSATSLENFSSDTICPHCAGENPRTRGKKHPDQEPFSLMTKSEWKLYGKCIRLLGQNNTKTSTGKGGGGISLQHHHPVQ